MNTIFQDKATKFRIATTVIPNIIGITPTGL